MLSADVTWNEEIKIGRNNVSGMKLEKAIDVESIDSN